MKARKRLAADALKTSSIEFLDTLEPEHSQAEQLNITPSEQEKIEFANSVEKSRNAHLFMSPEAQAILESTPELIKTESKLAELEIGESPRIDIKSAQKINQHNLSLFAEMEQLDTSTLDNTMTVEQRGLKEFDILLSENKDLVDLR